MTIVILCMCLCLCVYICVCVYDYCDVVYVCVCVCIYIYVCEGILWAGRDNAKRSFLYLIASKEFFDKARLLPDMTAADRAEMESTCTHNLFYLAQAYGNIGNVKLSSRYCHMVS